MYEMCVFCGVLGLMAGVLSEKGAHVVARDRVDHVTANSRGRPHQGRPAQWSKQRGSPSPEASCTVEKINGGRPHQGRPACGKFSSRGRPTSNELGWLVLKS